MHSTHQHIGGLEVSVHAASCLQGTWGARGGHSQGAPLTGRHLPCKYGYYR